LRNVKLLKFAEKQNTHPKFKATTLAQ